MVGQTNFVEGTEEKDLMEMVYCKAFRKFLKLASCNPENCKHHHGVESDKAEQDGKVVKEIKWVRCGYPEPTPVVIVCEA